MAYYHGHRRRHRILPRTPQTAPTSTPPEAVVRFGSVSELLDYAEQHAGSQANGSHDSSWTEGATFAEALRLAREGWPAGAAQVRGMADRYSDAIGSRILRPDPYLADTGESVDVGTFLAGEPEAFIAFRPVETHAPAGRIVTICLNLAVSAGVDAKVIIARGAAMLALAESLELAGRSTRIVAACPTRSGPGDQVWTIAFPIKEPDQPADLDRLAFYCLHPAMLRRILFAVFDGTGRSTFVPPAQIPADLARDLEADVTLDRGMYGEPQWTDTDAAQAWILGQLQAQGVSLTE